MCMEAVFLLKRQARLIASRRAPRVLFFVPSPIGKRNPGDSSTRTTIEAQCPDVARAARHTFGEMTVTIALQESEGYGVGMLAMVACLTAGANVHVQ